MATPSSEDVTQLLLAWAAGDHSALEQLTPLVYRQKRGGKARHVELEETAEVLEVSTRTVLREWSLAQVWLHRELEQ